MKPCCHFLFFIICLGFFLPSCKKHVVNPVDQLLLLPPETQTGARTVGCLVNGQAFIPKNQSFYEGPRIQCNYIYTAGGYYLNVVFGNKNNDGSITQISLQSDSLKIHSEETLPLTKYAKAGMASGSYSIYGGNSPYYHTNLQNTGLLTISNLDTVKQIVSGSFYFTAINSANDTIKVTSGRFDMPYTR